jgi:hypothetical protein
MRRPRSNREDLRAEIAPLLRRVAFSQTAIRLCENEGNADRERFLLRILRSEIGNRDEVRHARFLREAAFPVYKTLKGFEFASLKLPPDAVDS